MGPTELDRLLAEARDAPLQPSGDLLSRILADALAEQPAPAASSVPTRPAPTPRKRFWAALSAGFGGGGVLAGLGGAATLGLVLGYVDPTTLVWLTDGLPASSVTEVQLLPGPDFFLSEG